jgi:hypothetical protein
MPSAATTRHLSIGRAYRMKKLCLGLLAATAAAGAALPLQAGTIFLGAYPDKLLTLDEAKGVETTKLTLATGLPTSMRLSNDKKKLYVTTITTSGFEVIDTATKKVVNSFSLNTPTTRYRFNGGVADSAGRYFYMIGQKFDREVDRYRVGKPQYMVVDLQLKKVVRAVDIAPEDTTSGFRQGLMLSEDGKTLYAFRDKILIINTADFKVVQRIDLAKPDMPEVENISFGGGVEQLQSPREYVSLFNATDPYIKNKVFGIARFDLATRQFTFTPIGPAPASMAGLQVTPDGKEGYTVVTTGTLGNKRCEFWRMDLSNNKVLAKSEFECRSRFQFGMSGDGTKLYIYGASYNIEIYDAKTLKLEKDWDVGNDATGAGMVITG